MNNHNDIRDLLPLAAAGALEPAAQRQVEEHLSECSDCRAELASWQRLTGALEALPTPQAPLGLVERTRRQMENRAAAKAERRWNRAVLVWLTAFAWISTLLTWPLFQFFGGRLGGMLDLSSRGVTNVWIGYIVMTWTVTVIVAGLLGQRYQRNQEVRTI
jgi:anti-sigma factor RsiW